MTTQPGHTPWDAETWINLGALVINAAAAITAIVAAVMARRSAKEADKQQRIATNSATRGADALSELAVIDAQRHSQAVLDAKRAVLRAFQDPQWRGNRTAHYLLIRNSGGAEARNVAVTIDGKPLREHRRFVGPTEWCGPIGAGGEKRFEYSEGRSAAPMHVSLEWEEDSGSPGFWAHNF